MSLCGQLYFPAIVQLIDVLFCRTLVWPVGNSLAKKFSTTVARDLQKMNSPVLSVPRSQLSYRFVYYFVHTSFDLYCIIVLYLYYICTCIILLFISSCHYVRGEKVQVFYTVYFRIVDMWKEFVFIVLPPLFWPLALATDCADHNEWPYIQWFVAFFFFWTRVGTISLDRNYWEVTNLSFVSPGLHLNIL